MWRRRRSLMATLCERNPRAGVEPASHHPETILRRRLPQVRHELERAYSSLQLVALTIWSNG